MHVRDVMTQHPACCTPDTPIGDVARMMVDHDCGSIPVVADPASRAPIGIVTDRDIVTRTIAAGIDPAQLTAGDCMTAPPITITDGSTLRECVQLLELSRIRRAIVVDDTGGCIGIVAQADIAWHATKRETGDLVREVSMPSEPAFTS
ncbi:MAG TPA: CBS domain-containing protein [Kofleriaceae bacterium]|nr:CBS domain-containing protein [Kofleriaceae bacterium]